MQVAVERVFPLREQPKGTDTQEVKSLEFILLCFLRNVPDLEYCLSEASL